VNRIGRSGNEPLSRRLPKPFGKNSSEMALFARADQEVSDQWNSQREWHEQEILHQARALFQTFVRRVRFVFFRRKHRVDVFQEINAAFFALAAVPLLMLARRTLVAQRGVAPRAEPRDVASFRIALGALHEGILRGFGRRSRIVKRVVRPQR
jgi:hypothetical protein